MKHHVVVKRWILIAAVALLLPGAAKSIEDRSRSPLAGVKALENPVSYTETKIPLGELVQKVAADTGAPLSAAPEVGDEPVAVVVKELPARELLEQLADLLDYQWHRVPGRRTPKTQHPSPTLEIYQDLAGKQREAALREARVREVEK